MAKKRQEPRLVGRSVRREEGGERTPRHGSGTAKTALGCGCLLVVAAFVVLLAYAGFSMLDIPRGGDGRTGSVSQRGAARRSAPHLPPLACRFVVRRRGRDRKAALRLERQERLGQAASRKKGKAMKSNAVIENILDRRSVRAFTEEPFITARTWEAVVTCGQWAPSAMNRQEWCFVVVDDAKGRSRARRKPCASSGQRRVRRIPAGRHRAGGAREGRVVRPQGTTAAPCER